MAIDTHLATWQAGAEPAGLRAIGGLVWEHLDEGCIRQRMVVGAHHRQPDGRISMAAVAFLVDSTLGTAGSVARGLKPGLTVALRAQLLAPLPAVAALVLEATHVVVDDAGACVVTGVLSDDGGTELGSTDVRFLWMESTGGAAPREPASWDGGADPYGLESFADDGELRARPCAALANGSGLVFGGALAALGLRSARRVAETAAGGRPVREVTMEVDFFRPVQIGSEVGARASPVNVSRRFTWTDAYVTSAGKVVSRVRALGAIG